ncbi:MAG: hypothetical protein V1850_03360 [Candidatus Bathyarchaeota archaeon]
MLLRKFKPILSHDKEIIDYEVTEQQQGRFKTKKIRIKGAPAVFVCIVRGEKQEEELQQQLSRFFSMSPIMTREKYQEANKSIYHRKGTPSKIYEMQTQLHEKRKKCQDYLRVIRKKLLKLKSNVGFKHSMIWLPFEPQFPATEGEHMRHFERYLDLITNSALINVFQRPALVFDGCEYPIAIKEDYRLAFEQFLGKNIATTTITGLPQAVVNFFDKVFYNYSKANQKTNQPNEISVAELQHFSESVYRSLSKKTVTTYMGQLVNFGVAGTKKDPDDNRAVLYYLTKTSKGILDENTIIYTSFEKYNIFSLNSLKESWKSAISDRIFSSKFTPIKIIDADGVELSLEELYNKYFAPSSEDERLREAQAYPVEVEPTTTVELCPLCKKPIVNGEHTESYNGEKAHKACVLFSQIKKQPITDISDEDRKDIQKLDEKVKYSPFPKKYEGIELSSLTSSLGWESEKIIKLSSLSTNVRFDKERQLVIYTNTEGE